MSVGPCRGYLARWYFDATDATCKRFGWGGCRPNGNNFGSKAACERRCKCFSALPAPEFVWAGKCVGMWLPHIHPQAGDVCVESNPPLFPTFFPTLWFPHLVSPPKFFPHLFPKKLLGDAQKMVGEVVPPK